VDFQRVSKDKKIHMKVPLHFVNAENSPGVKEQAGVVSHVLNELDITCLPDDLPEFIEVDLINLSVGKSIHARDLALPKGVESTLHKDENPVVATCILPALITEEEEAAVAAATPAAGEVPTTAQALPTEEGAAAGAAAEKGKGGEKPAAEKGAEKAEKKEKK
jgi:large subunit ribosomal protein L25